MSLPDAPNTLREKYYSVMAGQNDADILPDIETAPSTENRYLDYMARHGGGGGGGDVTKAYVDEQDAKKTDKVTSAISGNFAGLDSNGNLTDSNKSAADFATASDMTAVKGVIPSTATTQNKLATAADTANKVDKVVGKGLSTEDYTTAEKTKLGTVETNATANTVINTSCTLAANGWTGASAPYTQTVNVASILATDRAYVDLSVSSTTATGIDEIENWAYISKVESGAGTLTFTCYEDKPDIDLNVNVQVVRGSASGSNTGVTYSTDEAMTGDVWIDGKPIYRRTIQMTAWSQTTNATSWNIDTFFVDYAHSYVEAHAGTTTHYILPFSTVGAPTDIYYEILEKTIKWRASNLSSNTFDAGYFTILYTKTTD